jgi:WD40 repeat protein
VDWDGFVDIWDLETGELIGEPIDESQLWSANAVAFSPDGTRFAVGGFGVSEATFETYGGIWLRDAETGEPFGEPLVGHTDEVIAVAFSPDGSHLVSAGFDGAVLLWDLTARPPTSQTLLEPDDQARSVGTVAFHPDGQTIVVGGYDWESPELLAGSLWIFDGAAGESLVLPTGLDEVLGLAFSPDGEFLASVSFEGLLTLWTGDLTEQIGAKQVSGSDAFANAVSFSPDGQMLATANSDGTVAIFDGETGNLIQDPLNAHRGGAFAVAFAPGVLFSGGADNRIRQYDLNNGQSIGWEALEHESATWSEFVAGGSEIASVDFETIQLWDVATATAAGEPIPVDENTFVGGIAVSPDGRLVAALTSDVDLIQAVVLWDAVTGESVGEPLAVADDVDWLAFSPDGTHLAVAGFVTGVELWDLRLGPAPVGVVESPDAYGWLGFSPDGSRMVSTDFDGRLRLWDVETGSESESPLIGHDGRVNAVAFHPDGEIMASASSDKEVRLWDLASGDPIGEPLLGHGGDVLDVVFSPDGTLLASAGQDTTVMIWRMDDLEHPITLAGHRGAVSTLSFISEGAAVVAADQRGTVRMWPTPAFWQPLACRAAGRNLTLKEWTDIVGTERAYERQCADFPSGDGGAEDARVVSVEY